MGCILAQAYGMHVPKPDTQFHSWVRQTAGGILTSEHCLSVEESPL